MAVEIDYIREFEKAVELMKKCKLIDIIGNGCYENPQLQTCEGVEKLIEKADYAVINGTTIYLIKC